MTICHAHSALDPSHFLAEQQQQQDKALRTDRLSTTTTTTDCQRTRKQVPVGATLRLE